MCYLLHFFFYGEVNGTEDVHLSPARLPILFHAHTVPAPDKRLISVNDSPESSAIGVNDLEEVKSAVTTCTRMVLQTIS